MQRSKEQRVAVAVVSGFASNVRLRHQAARTNHATHMEMVGLLSLHLVLTL